jgi:hypothetical protein
LYTWVRLHVGATRAAPTEPSKGVFASPMAWRGNNAAMRGAPNKHGREDSVAGAAGIKSAPTPKMERHAPPIPLEDAMPGPSSGVPPPEGGRGNQNGHAQSAV